MKAFLDWASVALPTILSLVGVFVSIETPVLETKRQRLLWRGALVGFGIIVSVVTFFQQKEATRDSETASTILKRIATAVGADKNASQDSLARLVVGRLNRDEKKITELSNPPREKDEFYQGGHAVAKIIGEKSSQPDVLTFQAVTTNHLLDFSKPMELGESKLECDSWSGTPNSIVAFGAIRNFTYSDVSCNIIGARKKAQ